MGEIHVLSGGGAVGWPFEMSKLKIALVGNFGVGKTSTIGRIVKKEFSEDANAPTVASDMVRYPYADGIDIVFTDTAGEERFKSMTSSFYRNCAAVLMIYDVTDEKSFQDIPGFMMEAERFNEKALKFLAGCKTDLEATTDANEVREWADREGLDGVFQISNKTGEGVDEMVEAMVQKLQEAKERGSAVPMARPSSTVSVEAAAANTGGGGAAGKKSACSIL